MERRPQREPPPIAPDPVIDAYKPGLDMTLVIENLRRTPEERIRNLMRLQEAAETIRRAVREVKK